MDSKWFTTNALNQSGLHFVHWIIMSYTVCIQSNFYTEYALNQRDLHCINLIKLLMYSLNEIDLSGLCRIKVFTGYALNHRRPSTVCTDRWRCVRWRHVTLVTDNSPFWSFRVHVSLNKAIIDVQRRGAFCKKWQESRVHGIVKVIWI